MNEQSIEFIRPTLSPGPAADPRQAVAVAIEALPPTRQMTVLINDPQRSTASRTALEIIALYVEPSKTRLLVATGSHRTASAEQRQFEAALGRDLHWGDIAWHDCLADDLVPIGEGICWRGHPWLLAEQALLVVGSVEPHYFAGWTGAHKTATIGCAAYEDIQANHAAALSEQCRPCRLKGNPVHKGIAEMLTALESIRPVSAVNLVQVGERIVAAAGGEPMDALTEAVPVASKLFCRRIESPAEAIIAEVAGPLGRSFYQAEKGIKNNEWAVRDGGTIVLAAPCPDGIGQGHFAELLAQTGSYDEAVAAVVRRGYRLGDHKAVRLRYLMDPKYRGVKLFVVSESLSARDAQRLGLFKAGTVGEALSAGGIDPSQHRVYHLQDAAEMCLTAGRPSAETS